MKPKISFNRKTLWFCFENDPAQWNKTKICCDFQCKVNLGLSSQELNQTHT